MMSLRKTKAGLMLLIALWLLTGCVKLNVDLVVNRDGSGVYGLAMGTTPELMALARDGNEDLAGGTVAPIVLASIPAITGYSSQ